MSGITYALIGIAMPASYRMELDSDLETQVFQLIEQLKQTTFEKSNLLFDRFLMNTNATLLIRLPDNTIISPPSSVIFEDSENDNVSIIKENENKILVGNGNNFSDTVYDLSNAKEYSFSFSDMEKDCIAIAQSMERTIQEIVTISRLDASDFSLGRADFDFSELVRVIAAEYIDFIEQKDMELDINISEHITVNADEKMMKKVLSNLFSNAIRHSPRGEQIVVTSFLKNGCVYFSILNTGVQIKEEAISHLYEVFYRADDSRSRRTGGSGLGLYIVKRILEQHSAQFSIQNLNDGVEFWFSL